MPKGKGGGKKSPSLDVPLPSIGTGPNTGNKPPTPGSGSKISPPAV